MWRMQKKNAEPQHMCAAMSQGGFQKPTCPATSAASTALSADSKAGRKQLQAPCTTTPLLLLRFFPSHTRTTFAHRYDDVDQYGQRTLRSRMSSVLALRATCHALRLAVDMIVRLPPLDFVPRLQAWLVANLGAPPLQLNNSFSSDFDWAARLALSSAHAELQQLRFGRSFPALWPYRLLCVGQQAG